MTFAEIVRLAKAARVKTVALYHHEPGHDDAMLDGIAAAAARAFPGAIVAREGAVLTP